jgi:hypothetical protein
MSSDQPQVDTEFDSPLISNIFTVLLLCLEFTVEMIFQSFMLYINPQLEERLILRIDCPCDVYVSGGGVKNRTIMMSVHVFFVNE